MRKAIPVIIAVVAGLAIYYYVGYRSNSEYAYGLAGTGNFEATEMKLGSPLAGLISEIRVEEGDRVSAGEVVAVIKHDDLLAQKQALASALEAVRAQIRQNKIKLDNAKVNFRRLGDLAGAGSVPQQRYDDAKAALKQAEAGLEAANYQSDNLGHQLQALEERISYATVTAPVAGIVTGKHFEVGELAPPGGSLLTVSDLSSVWLKIYVPEKELGLVKIGQKAKVWIDSKPDSTFEGRVTWISQQAEFTPKNIQTKDERVKLVYGVKITIDNSEGFFKIGMPADAEIIAGDAK